MTQSSTTHAVSILPFGSWPSPVTTAMVTSGAPGVREPGTNGTDLLWVETRPQERGRYVLVIQTTDGVHDVTPAPFNVRNRVHEYGGAAWAAEGEVIVFSNFGDNRLYRIDSVGSQPHPITPEGAFRYADLQIDRAHNRLLAIREDHSDSTREPVNTLVALQLDGPNADGGTVLDSGTDFIASPRLTVDGTRLTWITWNHPNMPWDATTLLHATLTPDNRLEDRTVVADGAREAAILPGWDRKGNLVYVSDRTGWWHLYRREADGTDTQLTSGEAEFGVPLWQFGASTWTELSDGTLALAWITNGEWSIGTLDPDTCELQRLDLRVTSISDLRTHPDGKRVIAKMGTTGEHAALQIVDPISGDIETIAPHSGTPLDPAYISVAEAISWTTPDGSTAHGYYYAPHNGDVSPAPGELPPLIVESHGGPTGRSEATFDIALQFWTSRGFAILDVNYGGSTGYGRAYRERLNDAWGVVDVDDCVSGALALADRGLVDRDRLIIRGGSAGGYTTLAALAFREVFAAGVSYYGIGDLEAMAADTHKFESRYLDGLVGPYSEAIDTYRERSAIHHVDRLSSAMLLLQGLDDKVVPPNQSTMMADAVRAKGLPVALLTFEGEGHGFRMAETMVAALEAELSFYGQVFGFTPADDIPVLKIDNL